ncbi:MAG: polyprenol monophosphomannose synthase [Planctomycetaceae bacterium]|jgi:dolichol-phosphate mannosyltransferase|nr:polyprenol monophosphomannose synthase [Planctomycetaceae bacterium]
MPKILISLATYNERENLPELTRQIFLMIPEADILVVDDSSPDGTADWVRERIKSESRLKLLQRPGKMGLGSAILAAMDYAETGGYDFFINLDADGSHPPRFLPAMLNKAKEGFDVVIGSRYVPGGKIRGWSLPRKMMSRTINFYARWVLGLKTRDNSGSFRCCRVALLRKWDRTAIIAAGYAFLEEMLFRLKKLGAAFAEIPIEFEERRSGQSKLNIREALSALLLILLIGTGLRK